MEVAYIILAGCLLIGLFALIVRYIEDHPKETKK